MRNERGALVADTLAGSWRQEPPPAALSPDQLEQISPLLLEAGSGALAWWRIRNSPLARSAIGEQLREAYRLHTLQAAVHERQLSQVVRALHGAGVEALLIKGWTAARLYAEPGLRPYGDIDVCVAPHQHGAALAALANAAPGLDVDVHRALGLNRRVVGELPSFDEALAGATQVPLAGVDALVPGPEDQLALMCVHLLSHGAWRPLWLCDVAAFVERLPDDFDWDRCLGRSPRLASWVNSTVSLAERLLDAQTSGEPIESPLPRWLERAVLKQWGSPRTYYPGELVDVSATASLRPSRAARLVRAHWVDPITATMFPRSSFNALPRLPYRVRYVAWKAARFLRRPGATSPEPARTTSSSRHG